MERINIMTSCDDRLARYILPQLVSISKKLSAYEVHFYLAHYRVSAENILMLKRFSEEHTNIIFHDIMVRKNIPFYEKLVEGGGGQWPCEAYFTLRIQDYLPAEVDRIMYIDAGDVIFDGDISSYYFDDFEGNSIIATPLGFKTDPATKEPALYTSDDILALSQNGSLFNSGSYIMDVEHYRNSGYTVEDYLYLHKVLMKNAEPGKLPYFGDQGFLAAAFAGDVKMFGYPQHKDPSYMPYNFRTSYWGLFKHEPNYKPVVLHYAIMSKPWVVRFTSEAIDAIIGDKDFIGNYLVAPIPVIAYMTPKHLRMCEVWWKYAEETPIYEEADIRARVTAENWIKYYFPMCTQYIKACIQINMMSK